MSTILGLDIGTEYAKAVLARIDKRGTLKVIGAGKAKQREDSMKAGAITDITSVVAACEEALVQVEDEAGERADATVVGISGELIKGGTTSVDYTRKDPKKPITEAEMTEIVKKVQQKAGAVAKDQVVLETGNQNAEVSLINSAIVSLSIDGYKIVNPIGFKGAEVSILIYTAFAPMIHVSAIEKVCAELNLDLLTVAAEPFAVCRAVVGDNADSDFSGILVDIGGGTTDLAIIKDGSLSATKAISTGASAIKRNLTAWLFTLNALLDDPASGNLPCDIYLCGGGAELPELEEALATSNWYDGLPFPRRPIIHLVDTDALPGLSLDGHPLDYHCATALGLLRVGADTLIGAPEENTLRARLGRILQN